MVTKQKQQKLLQSDIPNEYGCKKKIFKKKLRNLDLKKTNDMKNS
jgi:hypothetical protein